MLEGQVPHCAHAYFASVNRCATHAGIKRLDMQAPGTDGRKVWESIGITSPDGEPQG